MLLPEVGRVVRSRSKSENSSGSVSKPPTAVGAKMFGSAPAWGRDPKPSTLGVQMARHSSPDRQYLQCRCCWAWRGSLPRGQRRPGQVPRGQKKGVR